MIQLHCVKYVLHVHQIQKGKADKFFIQITVSIVIPLR